MSPPVLIARAGPREPAALALIAQSDAYLAALYPPESNHLLDPEALSRPEVRFFLARRGGETVASGAYVLARDGRSAEIKRMFVAPAARGLGIGRRMLRHIEASAAEEGITLLQLETGISQPEAIGLYRAEGYVERGPFGSYAPDPFSLFMEKALSR